MVWFTNKDTISPLKWLKRHEHDKNIYNHLRFITAFLKTEKPSDLFIKRSPYSFLEFDELITFDNAPSLDDDEWNPKTSKNDSVNTENWQQMELPLDILNCTILENHC